MPPMIVEPSHRIKAVRLAAGITQRGLARQLGVTPSAVAQWESGGMPTTERLTAVALALGVSLDRLVAPHPDSDPQTAAREAQWRRDNCGALADANAFLDRHGLWSDGKRQF